MTAGETYGDTHRLFSQACVIVKRCRVKDKTGRHLAFNLLPAIFHQPFPRLDPGALDSGDTRTTVRQGSCRLRSEPGDTHKLRFG